MVKYANSANNDAREVEFGSLDCGEDDKHNGVAYVEISIISVIHDTLFFVWAPFERVYRY